MSGLPDLTKDVSRRFRITNFDAEQIVQFIVDDLDARLIRGESLHLDRFINIVPLSDGSIRCTPSKFLSYNVRQSILDDGYSVSALSDLLFEHLEEE